jgi:hypothetical protein
MINFPDTPTNGQIFTSAGSSWRYDGAKWFSSGGVSGAAGSGTVTGLTAGAGIMLAPNPITTTGTISATAQPLSITAGTGLSVSPSPITGTGAVSLVVPVNIANGGTGAISAGGALTSLGAAPASGSPNYAPITGGNYVSSLTAGTGLTGGTITTSGTVALSVPVSIASGGTGSTTAVGALANLGGVSSTVLGSYLPLSGGTLSGPGNLTINGTTNLGNWLQWAGVNIMYRDGTYTYIHGGGGQNNVYLGGDQQHNYYRNNAHHIQSSESQGDVEYMYLDGGTVNINPGNLHVYGTLWMHNNLCLDHANLYYIKDTGGTPRAVMYLSGDQLILTSPNSQTTINGNLTTGYMTMNTGGVSNGYFTVADFRSNGNLYAPGGYVYAPQSDCHLGRTYFHWDCLPLYDGSYQVGYYGQSWAAMSAYGYGNPSSRAQKTDIQPIDHALDAVMKLKPVGFYWKNEPVLDPDGTTDRKYHSGFIADEVAGVFGNHAGVYRTDGEHEAIYYHELVAVLWRAVQELAEQCAKSR